MTAKAIHGVNDIDAEEGGGSKISIGRAILLPGKSLCDLAIYCGK